jgi:hypothetical protein
MREFTIAYNGEIFMPTNRPGTSLSLWQKIFTSSLVFRVIFALAIGLLVVMAFFATNAR